MLLRKDVASAKEMTTMAKEIQDQTLESTGRAKKVIAETVEIGADASTKLKAQTAQLERVDKGLDDIESNVKRANKQLRAFVR